VRRIVARSRPGEARAAVAPPRARLTGARASTRCSALAAREAAALVRCVPTPAGRPRTGTHPWPFRRKRSRSRVATCAARTWRCPCRLGSRTRKAASSVGRTTSTSRPGVTAVGRSSSSARSRPKTLPSDRRRRGAPRVHGPLFRRPPTGTRGRATGSGGTARRLLYGAVVSGRWRWSRPCDGAACVVRSTPPVARRSPRWGALRHRGSTGSAPWRDERLATPRRRAGHLGRSCSGRTKAGWRHGGDELAALPPGRSAGRWPDAPSGSFARSARERPSGTGPARGQLRFVRQQPSGAPARQAARHVSSRPPSPFGPRFGRRAPAGVGWPDRPTSSPRPQAGSPRPAGPDPSVPRHRVRPGSPFPWAIGVRTSRPELPRFVTGETDRPVPPETARSRASRPAHGRSRP